MLSYAPSGAKRKKKGLCRNPEMYEESKRLVMHPWVLKGRKVSMKPQKCAIILGLLENQCFRDRLCYLLTD